MTESQDFTHTDLRGARFVECDLSRVVMRGVDVGGADIDAPWLCEPGGTLFVNGVDVAPLVDAELDRRSPGRSLRRADSPDGLREAWAAVEGAWAATLARVDAMPPGTADVSVATEWTFAETLRHLVMATDVWLGRGIHALEQPFHPLGKPHTADADNPSFSISDPSYDEVLAVRAERQAMVRDHIEAVTPELLREPRANPHNPERGETVCSCLHVILEEEWEHHRYAVRDLDAIASGGR